MNPIKKLAGQTAIYGFSSILGRLLNYLLVPIYTRVFIPSEFGVIAELYAYIAFLNILLTYGMETSFFRHYNNSADRNKVFSSSFISICLTSILFFILIISFLNPLAGIIRYAANPEYLIWVALIVVLDAVATIPFARLRALNKPKKFAVVKLLNIGLNIGFNLFFLLFCPYILKNNISSQFLSPIINFFYNENIGVGYVFISNLIASGVTFILFVPSIINAKPIFDKKVWKTMIIYAWPLLLAGFAGIINETIDRILIKFLLPENISMTQLGIYSACYKISIIITIFIQAFRFAADPFFFAESKNKNAKHIYALVMKYFIIICLLIFLGIMMYIDFIKYFVGDKYHDGLTVVPILLIANIFLGIYYNLSIWYKLSDKTIYGAYFSIFGAIVTIVLNLFWIPVWGYVGAAWATLICYFSMMVASYIIGQKNYKVNYDVKRIGFYFVLTFVLFILTSFLKPLTGQYYIAINTIVFILFTLLVVRLEFNKKNRDSLKEVT
ncbi:MAG: polysaccharide biosynthesis C-terminal domain-containing protein [Bacteroidales bacterium]|nr:polysaccharide biosynthesis C-terminal domain-containing protein [Bacteroidales bacterium]